MKARSELLEQRELCGIPEWTADRVQPNAHSQAKDRRHRMKSAQRDVDVVAALEPAHKRMGYTCGATDRRLTEIRCKARLAQLRSDRSELMRGFAADSIGAPLLGRHAARMRNTPFLSLNRWSRFRALARTIAR